MGDREQGSGVLEEQPVREAAFTVVYDGPALADHTIDVRDLAPALLALGDLFEEANRLCNGERAKVNLAVRATPQGSFEIDLRLIQTLAQQLTQLLTGNDVTAALNLREIVLSAIGGGYGLFKLIKWLRGRRPDEVTREGNNVTIRVEATTIVIDARVFALYESERARRAAAEVVRPLESEGITVLKIKDESGVIEEVSRDDRGSFNLPVIAPTEEPLVEEVYRKALTLVSVVFREDNKWRVSDGPNEFHVTMADTGFMGEVERGAVSFAAGDVLICKLRARQSRFGNKLRSEYEVEQVIEHRKGQPQTAFDFNKR